MHFWVLKTNLNFGISHSITKVKEIFHDHQHLFFQMTIMELTMQPRFMPLLDLI